MLISQNWQLIINVSRIGERGTGLAAFSRSVIECLINNFVNLCIAAPPDSCLSGDFKNVAVYQVPKWVAMTQHVSRLRPLLWLIYSYFGFPKRGIIISTTHHALPTAKQQIITIHDLRPYFFPDTLLQKIYFRYYLPHVLKKIAGVLTVSQATKDLIVKHYRVSGLKVYVVHNCVDTSRFTPVPLSEKNPYLLMVGANWRHKNAHEFLQMHQFWADQYTVKIIIGNKVYRQYLSDLCAKYHLTDKVQFLSYVREDELVTLYQGASALVYPSLMEGFGIPPLEAIACNTPVIVSDIPVFREIYGNAAIYVQLGNADSWRNAFHELENPVKLAVKMAYGKRKLLDYTGEIMCMQLRQALLDIFPTLEQRKI